jgi:type IV fimbrial biogenesis protein FimT
MKALDGFSAIELMITVAVIAITLTVAVPSLQTTIQNNKLAANTNQFVATLNFARSEAIKRGGRITIRKTSANWESGWQVFTDIANFGTLNGNEEVLRIYGALPTNYTLRGNNNFTNYISFMSSGSSNNIGSFAMCYRRDNNPAPKPNASRVIIVNAAGRVRIGLDTNNNGIPEKDNGVDLASCTNP